MSEEFEVFLVAIIMLGAMAPLMMYILDTTFEKHKKNKYTGDDDGNKR